MSCGGGTYKGSPTCAKCTLQAARAQRSAQCTPAQPRPRVPCWICGKPMTDRPRAEGRQPTCNACTREHGAGVCTECGGPMRIGSKTAASPERRRCRDCRRANAVVLEPRICELCEETYVPKYRSRQDRPHQQRWCSKSCKTAWQNGARPPYTRRSDIGDAMMRKKARCRARLLRHAQTWDGITDEEILERDGWRCQIPGCKRRPIRKDVRYPHPRSKSIDHIVPLSLGGDDTAVNKRASHLGCNLARGNQMAEEQLLLFGSVREAPLATVTAGERAVLFQKRKRFCECGAVPLEGRKFCQCCLDQRAADAEDRQALKMTCQVRYYACRYCMELKVERVGTGHPREVCPARTCQLARLAANNLRLRNGLTAEEADAQAAALVKAGKLGYGRWQRGAAA